MPALLKAIFNRRMLVCFLMGFSCGLPLLLIMGLAQAWMKDAGVDLGLIGLIALVQIPYTVKFLWAPVMDRFTPSFLGRRRGWLLMAQVLLLAAIAAMGLSNPGATPWLLVLTALMVAFFSASQDIVVDAYRREDLPDEELGLGSSLYVYGYRLGMLLAGGGGLILADHFSFPQVYLMMAGCMLLGIFTTLLTPEPATPEGKPLTIREAVVDPFREFFRRSGYAWAFWVLAFILLYKVGDTMASAMTTPFYLDIGFTKTEIGAVVKVFGFWATLGGLALGGLTIVKLGINPCLWIFGFLQMVSTAGFAVLSQIGPSVPWLAGVIGFENLSSGMGTAVFVAFMAALTSKRFTATQYALLTSLMGVPRSLLSAPTGFMAESMGWFGFFMFCTLVALPGMLLLFKFAPLGRRGKTAPAAGA